MKNNLVAMILSLSLAGIAIVETGQEPGRRNSAKQRIVKTTSVQVSAYDQLIQNGVQPEDLYSYPSEFWARSFYFDRSTGELLVATSRDYDLDEAIRKGVVSQDATSDTGKITGNVFVIERLLVTDVSVNADSGDVQFAAPNGTIDIHAIREGLLLVKVAPVEDTFDFHPMRFHIRLIAQPDQKDAVRALRAPMPQVRPTICKCDTTGCGGGCTIPECDTIATCGGGCGSCAHTAF